MVDLISIFLGASFLGAAFLETVFLTGLGFLTETGLLTAAGFLTVFLERRGLSPSIDLFFSIVYNYSIWELN